MEVREFRAMGSQCRIVIDAGPAGLADRAADMVEALEQKWSRFRSDSEISKINAAPDNLHLVSAQTFQLIEQAAYATSATGGVFNPLMLDQLETLGYSQSWSDGPVMLAGSTRQGSSDEIELYPDIFGVRLPTGARFDPGGIGKGLAADLITEMINEHDTGGSSLELGGDLRVSGTAWYGPEWRIDIAHPLDNDRVIAARSGEEGAVATSSTLRKRWQAGDDIYHHLLDPSTGMPAATDLVTVSATSSSAAWAEIAVNVVLIGGSDGVVERFVSLGVSGVAVTADGIVLATPSTGESSPSGRHLGGASP